jgi:hypothetical protein
MLTYSYDMLLVTKPNHLGRGMDTLRWTNGIPMFFTPAEAKMFTDRNPLMQVVPVTVTITAKDPTNAPNPNVPARPQPAT